MFRVPAEQEQIQVLEGTIQTPARLDKALAEATGLSRARVQGLIDEGRVDVAGKTAASASAKVAAGTPFRITIAAAMPAEALPEDIPLTIAYEDAQLIVVDKPAGMVVHPAVGNITGTLVNALLHHCRGNLSGINGVARPGIVHRIDKDTSGLLVVAKSDAAHEGLAVQFAAHTVHRRYLAVCAGHPSPADGTINARLGRSDTDRKKMTVLANNSSRGKSAITHYKVLERFDHAALIECRLETGRTHQVRVHCASIGHALIGDPAYGRIPKALRSVVDELGFARQALHAAELGFVHPLTGESLRFSSNLPQDMQELIDQLRHSDR
jgi:23S rRNA pseudouridine1911/1915/1917 synthase